VIIELYGLPGSGKTTIARTLQGRGGKYVYLHTSPKSETIRLVPLFTFKNPIKSLFWFKELLKESVRFHFSTFFRYKLHLLLISITQYQKARHDGVERTYLIDEGLIQRILSISETKISIESVKQYLKHIPKADIIVVVENKPTEFYRFKESPHRHKSPRLHLGEKYFENWMKITRHNHEIIKSVLKDTQNNIIFCDGADGLDDCVNKIEKIVKI